MTNNLQSYLTIWERENTKDDIAIFNVRLLNVTPENENYPMNITHLFPTNASVDAHKNALYTLSKTDKAQIKAVDMIGDTSDDHKRQIKDKIPDDPTKTMDFYSQVSVATEAKYDLISNVDVTDGLTNGVGSVIGNIAFRVENFIKLSIIWVSFPHLEIGRKQCRGYAYLHNTHMNKNWTPVLEVTKRFQINKKVKYKFFDINFHLDLLLPKLFIVVKVTH